MTVQGIEKLMLSGVMPGGNVAVTRRQVSYFLMKVFKVGESEISHWRKNGIPEKHQQALAEAFPELGGAE